MPPTATLFEQDVYLAGVRPVRRCAVDESEQRLIDLDAEHHTLQRVGEDVKAGAEWVVNLWGGEVGHELPVVN
jgi:hypothetical protein